MSRISSEWAIQLVWVSLTRRRVAAQAVGERNVAVGKRPCVSFEEHRHHVGVNDGGIHCGLEERVPSRRQSRRLAENSSTDSSSGNGFPRRVSKSSIGVAPC